jgi:hypothetical protein
MALGLVVIIQEELIMKKWLLLFLVVLAGCAAQSQPEFKADLPQQGLIYEAKKKIAAGIVSKIDINGIFKQKQDELLSRIDPKDLPKARSILNQVFSRFETTLIESLARRNSREALVYAQSRYSSPLGSGILKKSFAMANDQRDLINPKALPDGILEKYPAQNVQMAKSYVAKLSYDNYLKQMFSALLDKMPKQARASLQSDKRQIFKRIDENIEQYELAYLKKMLDNYTLQELAALNEFISAPEGKSYTLNSMLAIVDAGAVMMNEMLKDAQ